MQITSNIWSLDCSSHSHIYVIKINNAYVMIDTGLPGLTKRIYEELAIYNIHARDIKYVLLTHGDVDHIGNLQNIVRASNCEIYASVDEIPYLEKKKRYSIRKWWFKVILHIGKIVNVRPLPDKSIDDIEIIETPGHTPGHVCFKFNDYLFVGDLINTRDNKINLMKRQYTFDYQQTINSINNLDITNINYICPAHGDIIKASPVWQIFIQQLK